ncbi:MAG: hypothetical protein NTV89_04690 [Proteobacteria bacterium]|nr:hypothetical protein [Pseudomonadota bacterium]
MVWMVGLKGDRSDLEALAKSLNDPQITVIQEGDEFFLSSAALERQSSAEAVHEEAKKLTPLLNGATRLVLNSRERVTLGAISKSRANGKHDTIIFPEPLTIAVHMIAPTIRLTHIDGTVEEYHPADPIRDWMKIALIDSAVAKVLQIIGSEHLDWVNLYRIFEIIVQDCGGSSSIKEQGWATEKTMILFKHTANSPGTIGLAARHGVEHKTPPPKPMTISEARTLMDAIVHFWLQSKV